MWSSSGSEGPPRSDVLAVGRGGGQVSALPRLIDEKRTRERFPIEFPSPSVVAAAQRDIPLYSLSKMEKLW